MPRLYTLSTKSVSVKFESSCTGITYAPNGFVSAFPPKEEPVLLLFSLLFLACPEEETENCRKRVQKRAKAQHQVSAECSAKEWKLTKHEPVGSGLITSIRSSSLLFLYSLFKSTLQRPWGRYCREHSLLKNEFFSNEFDNGQSSPAPQRVLRVRGVVLHRGRSTVPSRESVSCDCGFGGFLKFSSS